MRDADLMQFDDRGMGAMPLDKGGVAFINLGGAIFILGDTSDGEAALTCMDDGEQWRFPDRTVAKAFARNYRPVSQN